MPDYCFLGKIMDDSFEISLKNQKQLSAFRQ